jgi:hypothetical protein
MSVTFTRYVVTALAAGIPAVHAAAQPPETPLIRTGGTDGLVGQIFDSATYGTRTIDGTLMRSFAIGTFAWDMGDRPMEWAASTNQHALLIQNVYRATGNRFEQVGMSWAKHVSAAANSTINAAYGPCITAGLGGARLGVNCADLYNTGLNAAQGRLGPHFDVNPTTGAFSFPFSAMVPAVVAGDNAARRVIARDADTQPASNPGASYYAEAALYSPDDAAWGNGRNNFSSRRYAAFPAMGQTQQALSFDGASYRTSALEYWGWATPGVRLTRADIFEQSGTVVDKWDPYVPGDTSTPMLPAAQWVTLTKQLWTRYIASSAVTDNGNGTWTYDYAILNMNSHRGAGEFGLHLAAGAQVDSSSFHAPFYHSGDRFRNAPWLVSNSAGKFAWRVDPATETVTFPAVGPVTLAANALMFGTTYSFRITVNRPPVVGTTHMALWRAPADTTGEQGSIVALTGLTVPSYCVADIGSAGSTPGPDGTLDNNDFGVFVSAYFADDRFRADVGKQGGLRGPDNLLNNNDIVIFIDEFFGGCP